MRSSPSSSSALAEANSPQSENGGLGAALADVSERTTAIVREEIELAKAEISDKITKLAMAAAVGAAAGIFIVVGLLFLLDTVAWAFWAGLYHGSNIWAGFLTTAGLLFILAGLGGFLVWRLVKKGTPPVPKMAIDEAKLVRESFKSPTPEPKP